MKAQKIEYCIDSLQLYHDRGKDEANLEHKKGTEQPVLKSGFLGGPLSTEIPVFKIVHQAFSHCLTSHCFSPNF